MDKEYINPPELATYPMDISNHVVKAGATVYIAGQVPRGLVAKAAHVATLLLRYSWSGPTWRLRLRPAPKHIL